MKPDTDIPPVRQIARRVAVWLLLLAAGALLVTQLPGLEELPAHLASADPGWIAAALLLEIASTLAFAAAFHGAYGRRTTARQSVTVSMAVQGANILLPAGGTGGLAVGAVILDRAGIPRSVAASRTVALFLVTSAVSFVALVLGGVGVASGVLHGDVALVMTLVPAVGGLAVLLAVMLIPRTPAPSAAAPAGRVARAVWNARVYGRDGVASTAEMLRGRDWLVIGGAIGYYAFDVAALAAAFHALGAGSLPIGLLVLAYTLGHGGAIVPLPGSRGRADRHARALRSRPGARDRGGPGLPRRACGRSDGAWHRRSGRRPPAGARRLHAARKHAGRARRRGPFPCVVSAGPWRPASPWLGRIPQLSSPP